MSKPSVGVIGLGIMGLAMAKNLAKAGFTVVAFNRSQPRQDQAKKAGIKLVPSPQEAAKQSDVVIVIVTDPKALFDVLEGSSGVFSVKGNGKTLIQMSTIDGKSTQKAADLAARHEWSFIDCPVTGSKKQVEEAQLILLAGGDDEAIDNFEPLFKAIGKHVVHAGPVGMGTALKLCMNLIVAQMTTALCESVALARAQNLEPERIFEVVKNSPALNCGYYNIKEKNLLEGEFSAAFSLNNMLKDVRFMSDTAREKRVMLPVTQAVKFLMEAAVTDGRGDEDLTTLVNILKPNNQPANS